MSTVILYISTSKDGHMGVSATQNRKKYFTKTGIDPEKIVDAVPVHGNKIKIVSTHDGGKNFFGFDGLVTNDKDLTLALTCADCMPIAFLDSVSDRIGLIHCGFRGLDNGIIGKAVKKMASGKSENGKLSVYIGPHICKDHYRMDLAGLAVKQLINAGIDEKNITIDPRCTFEDKTLFSYRRGDAKNRNLYLFTLDI